MKFSLDQTHTFEWPGLKGRAYNSLEDFPQASAAYIEVTSRHGKVKTTSSDRVYYVIEGKGEFTINNEAITVQKNDVIIVPKNTPYDYKTTGGILKLFLVHTPAYNPECEIKLENIKGGDNYAR